MDGNVMNIRLLLSALSPKYDDIWNELKLTICKR